MLSHRQPWRRFARNCLPRSSLRRFRPLLAGALTGASCSISTPPQHTAGGGRKHRHSFVDCLQVEAESRGPSCRPAELVFPAPRPAATGHSRQRRTLWLPGASLTCPLLDGSTPGVGFQSGRTLGRDVDAPREAEVARSDQLQAARGRTGTATAHGVSEVAMTEQGRVADPAPGHFETDQPRLVADLSRQWSRFGVLCLGLARFRPMGLGLGCPSRTASGAFRPCFQG